MNYGTVFTAHLRRDIPASIVLFLVAMPLCLGVALASGAPLSAGVIAGILGGLLVAPLSGSSLMVSGPAAGLTAVVFTSIERLGGFETFLVSVVIAGGIQIIFGLARMGFIAKFFPSAVVKGMLAAIGCILILKQLPHALGYDADAMGDEAFLQLNHENTFSALGAMFARVEPAALALSGSALILLVLWGRPAFQRIQFVPGPLVVVILGVIANEVLLRVAPDYALGRAHLVTLPLGHMEEVWAGLTFPRWSAVSNLDVWVSAGTLALIASLETLMSLEATDKLANNGRKSPPNRELVAQGLGNMVSGIVGGLPLTGVVVRSATNINAGARSRASAVIHSFLLLVTVLAFPWVLNRIPLAVLAAVLIHVGWRLAHPIQLFRAWHIGRDQFVPFTVTLVAILLTNLLAGMLIGLCVGTFFILKEHAEAPGLLLISPPGAVLARYSLGPQATFLSRVRIENTLNSVPANGRVEIDARDCRRIDPDVLEFLHEFRRTAAERHIDYRLVGVPDIQDPRPILL